MPIYEYQCPIHGIFARIRPVSACKETALCFEDDCIIDCGRIWSTPAPIRTPDDSRKSFVYFQNKSTGEVDFTSTPQVYQRPGFEKKEARNLHEREIVEKKLRSQDDLRLSVQAEKRDFERSHSTSARHSDLRNYINQGVVVEKIEGETVTTHLDEQGKDILKAAMERTNNLAPKRRNSELKFDINHSDKSTRGTKE